MRLNSLQFLIVLVPLLKDLHANCVRKMVSATLFDMQIRTPSCVNPVKRSIASNAFRTKLIKISTEKDINAVIAVEVKILMNYSMMIKKPFKRKYGNSLAA